MKEDGNPAVHLINLARASALDSSGASDRRQALQWKWVRGPPAS